MKGTESQLLDLLKRAEEDESLRIALRNRSTFTIGIVAGFPHPRSGVEPFIVSRFPYPEDCMDYITCDSNPLFTGTDGTLHPIHIALKWKACIEHDESLSFAKIANRQGISRARVSQIMSLLRLYAGIQEYLKCLNDQKELRFFSERKLRSITKENEMNQLKAFIKLCCEFKRRAITDSTCEPQE